MQRVGRWAFLGSAVLCGATIAAAGAGSRPSAAGDVSTQAPASVAPEPFTRVCGKCHEAERIISGRRMRSQWAEVVDKMVTEGAAGSDQDFEVVMTFLVSEYGRVNVNTAPASEIAQVLHLDAAAAGKIVEHRRAHGRFEDFAALAAMPDAPVDALTRRRDAIVF